MTMSYEVSHCLAESIAKKESAGPIDFAEVVMPVPDAGTCGVLAFGTADDERMWVSFRAKVQNSCRVLSYATKVLHNKVVRETVTVADVEELVEFLVANPTLSELHSHLQVVEGKMDLDNSPLSIARKRQQAIWKQFRAKVLAACQPLANVAATVTSLECEAILAMYRAIERADFKKNMIVSEISEKLSGKHLKFFQDITDGRLDAMVEHIVTWGRFRDLCSTEKIELDPSGLDILKTTQEELLHALSVTKVASVVFQLRKYTNQTWDEVAVHDANSTSQDETASVDAPATWQSIGESLTQRRHKLTEMVLESRVRGANLGPTATDVNTKIGMFGPACEGMIKLFFDRVKFNAFDPLDKAVTVALSKVGTATLMITGGVMHCRARGMDGGGRFG